MVGKTAPIKVSHRQRFKIIKEAIGCLPCACVGYLDVHTSIEHVTDAGRRLEGEHDATIGLCAWHHFGTCHPGRTRQWMSGEFGPSLAWGRRVFEEHFGDEVTVLLPLQDLVIGWYLESPWPDYTMPRNIARKLRIEWIELNHAYTTRSSEA
ncbi:MAG: hypothetical protein AMJ84_00010 [Acidithiobacillales bacterium SM23_46]|nr:MAG: hypothetical protein AMJ84_00010 [Acidithiobacillales bacterium SM23_46]KPL28997.1 MAG: hypothetical protein AMJ72_00105 [Acidithiobacillales bacterium SM1_46]